MSSVLGNDAAEIISSAGIDPTLRGEALNIDAYCEIARKNY
jgi:hypothetical protein